jgi:transposase
VTEVARRHDVHPNLLHLWRRQARTGVLSVAADDTARFVPVAIATGNGAAAVTADGVGLGPVIEVVLRNGRVLRLPEGVAPARAVALADALEGLAR